MKKRNLYIILVLIVFIVGLTVIFPDRKKEIISDEDVIYNELIKYAKEIDKTYSIKVFYSDTEEKTAIYTLKTIRELNNEKIKKLSICDEENTYIEIYVNRKGNDRYNAVLDCNFETD